MLHLTRWQIIKLLFRVLTSKDFRAALNCLIPAPSQEQGGPQTETPPTKSGLQLKYDPISSRMTKALVMVLMMAVSVATSYAAGYVEVMDPITRLGKRLIGGDGITISGSTFSASGTASAFANYTTIARLTESAAAATYATRSAFGLYTSNAAPNLALAGTALQPGDVVNDLTSGGAAVPLSAEQGKVLQDGKVATTDPRLNVYNVKSMGILGDGSDEGPAIQALLTAAAWDTTFYFPKGVYGTSIQLVLPQKAIHIIGEGYNVTTFKALSAMTSVLYKAEGTQTIVADFLNFSINCNGLANIGMELQAYKQPKINRIYVYDFLTDGMLLGLQTGATHLFYEAQISEIWAYVNTNVITDPVNRPDHGIHLQNYATDNHLSDIVVANVKESGILNDAANNQIARLHVFGYPETYQPNYGIDLPHAATVSQLYADGVAVAGAKIAGGVSIVNSIIQRPAAYAAGMIGFEIADNTAGVHIAHTIYSNIATPYTILGTGTPGAGFTVVDSGENYLGGNLTLTGNLSDGTTSKSVANVLAGAPNTSSYVALASDAGLANERVLTGTTNQVTVTDGGAGGAVTLSLPQSIATGSTVQFGGLGVNTTNSSGLSEVYLSGNAKTYAFASRRYMGASTLNGVKYGSYLSMQGQDGSPSAGAELIGAYSHAYYYPATGTAKLQALGNILFKSENAGLSGASVGQQYGMRSQTVLASGAASDYTSGLEFIAPTLAGTLTYNHAAVRVANQSVSGKTTYGIKVDDQGTGNSIVTGTGVHSFGDNVGITGNLTISGTINNPASAVDTDATVDTAATPVAIFTSATTTTLTASNVVAGRCFQAIITSTSGGAISFAGFTPTWVDGSAPVAITATKKTMITCMGTGTDTADCSDRENY